MHPEMRLHYNLLHQGKGCVSLIFASPASGTGPGPSWTPVHPVVHSLIMKLIELTVQTGHCPGTGVGRAAKAKHKTNQALPSGHFQPREAPPPAGSLPFPTISPWCSLKTRCPFKRPHSWQSTTVTWRISCVQNCELLIFVTLLSKAEHGTCKCPTDAC